MSRSVWKLKPINLKLLSKSLKIKVSLQTRLRNTVIIKEFINKTIHVYNGMNYFPLIIRPVMVGYKLGDFIFSKKLVVHKIKKVKK